MLTFQVQHLNWVNQFKIVRNAIGIKWPGYMIHECGAWSSVHEKWYFLPRRCSNEPYNETKDEVMGCNYLITADANFKNVEARQVNLARKNYFLLILLLNTLFDHHEFQNILWTYATNIDTKIVHIELLNSSRSCYRYLYCFFPQLISP